MNMKSTTTSTSSNTAITIILGLSAMVYSMSLTVWLVAYDDSFVNYYLIVDTASWVSFDWIKNRDWEIR